MASTALVLARDFAGVPRRGAEDALRLVPGVTVVQHGSEGKGYQFLVRGFDAQHGVDFEVTVDGLALNEWSNVHAQGYLDLGFVIPELVTSVRVTKGPFTLAQGAFAMAGSADYHLGVAADDRGLRMAYMLGTSNRHRGVVIYSPRTGNGHEFIASETLHDDGFGQRRGLNKGTALARTELFRSARLGELSLLSGGHLARFELPGALRSADLAAGHVGFRDSYTSDSRGVSLRGFSALRYEKRAGDQWVRGIAHVGLRRLGVLENFTGYLFDRKHGDFREQRHDALSLGLRLSLTSQLSSWLDAHWGLGVTADVLEQDQRHTDARGRPIAQERQLRVDQALTSASAGVTLRPAAVVRLDLGARADLAHVAVEDRLAGGAGGSGTLPVLSPRAVLEWRALAGLRLLAAYGRGFRPPEARAFSSFRPQLGLGEEVIDDGEPAMTTCEAFELGARYRIDAHWSAQLSGFATFVARESVYDHVSGVNVELNGTRRLGMEVALRSQVTDFVTLSGDTTFVDARFASSGSPVPFAPTLSGGAHARFGRERGVRGGLHFVAVAPRALPHGARSSAHTRLDATAGYHWHVWRLDLEVENLLDQSARESEHHFASRWQHGPSESRLPSLHYVAGPPLNARLTLGAVF